MLGCICEVMRDVALVRISWWWRRWAPGYGLGKQAWMLSRYVSGRVSSILWVLLLMMCMPRRCRLLARVRRLLTLGARELMVSIRARGLVRVVVVMGVLALKLTLSISG